MGVFDFVYDWAFYIIWPMWKWLLKKLSGLCELQRICHKLPEGAARTLRAEQSMQNSKTVTLKRILADDELDIDSAVLSVIKTKDISDDDSFGHLLRACLIQINGYRQLCKEAETLRTTSFDSENEDHENMLLELWRLLEPDRPLEGRITKSWNRIGFQGDDPKTDFRGMGLLGLSDLLFFASQYTDAARAVLSHSHHPQYGYSFAIVGINITSMAYNLLRRGHLKVHLYNAVHGPARIVHLHQIYCYLFHEFDAFWMSKKPRDIMEFNRVRDEFEANMRHLLHSGDHVTLRAEFMREKV